MENYGSNDSGDKDNKTETSGSTAKPNIAQAQSFAELLLRKEEDTRRTVIWQREEQDKNEKDEADKSKDDKPLLPRAPIPLIGIEQVTSQDASDDTEPIDSVEDEAEILEPEDVKLAELEPDESRAIVEQYAISRAAELRDEEAAIPTGTPEQAAAEADAAMMHKLVDKLRDEPDADPRQAAAAAADEVIAEHDLAPEPVASTADTSSETSDADPTEPPLPPPTSAAGGGGEPPEEPPRPPFGPGFPGYPFGSGVDPAASGPATSESSTTSWGSRNITPIEAQYYARQAENRGLVIGGVVGYLIGRRRGRIKTERRLLPIQRKLEREVTDLHDTIAAREQQVRTLAAQKARLRQEVETKVPAVPITNAETPKPIASPNTTPQPARIANAELIPEPDLLPVPVTRLEQQALVPVTEGSPQQRVERMNQDELLDAAEKVIIEGATLRQIYESRHITEPGLRHVMAEYLRGGNVKRVLDQELAIKELTYERDPQLRDLLSGTPLDTPTGAAPQQVALGHTAASATLDAALVASQAPDSPIKRTSKKPSAPNNLLQGTLIRVWVVFVVVLVILAVILLIR